MDVEKEFYQPKEVADYVGISSSYLRQYCTKLEELGYEIRKLQRGNGRRVFTRRNRDDIKYLKHLIDVEGYTVDDAVHKVVERSKTDRDTIDGKAEQQSLEKTNQMLSSQLISRERMKVFLSTLTSEQKDDLILKLMFGEQL